MHCVGAYKEVMVLSLFSLSLSVCVCALQGTGYTLTLIECCVSIVPTTLYVAGGTADGTTIVPLGAKIINHHREADVDQALTCGLPVPDWFFLRWMEK